MPEICLYWNHHLPAADVKRFYERQRLASKSFRFRQLDLIVLDCPVYTFRRFLDHVIRKAGRYKAYDLKYLMGRYIFAVLALWLLAMTILLIIPT